MLLWCREEATVSDLTHAQVFSPEFEADPHPVYAELRRESPVRLVTMPGGLPAWLVTRYADARQALADPRLAKAPAARIGGLTELPDWVVNGMGQHMLNVDAPDHTRLRRLVSAAFTVRRIEALRPRIEQITDELLDAMAGQDVLDLIDAFAFPLPIQVICELLGVPVADRDSFRAWTNAIIGGLAARDELPAAAEGLVRYLRDLVRAKRAAPADDLLSALVGVRADRDQLTEDELTSMGFLLLIAGHETTVNLISNAVYALLNHPDQLAGLRAEPALLPAAIEEFLRYESPVETSTFRVATEPVEIAGQLIPAGHVVLIGLLSANHDDTRFPDPDRLDVTREDNPHLAFGHGLHHCLGAPLARLEAQIALGRLLPRYPAIRLAVPSHEVTWKPGTLIRGLTTLPVHLR
jgi:cytochrome P450